VQGSGGGYPAAFHDKSLQEIILEFPVGCDGSIRVEDCEYDKAVITCIRDAGQCAHSAIGARKRTGFADDGTAVFLSRKTPRERTGVDAGDGKDVLRLHVVQIEPEHELAEELDGCAGSDAIDVQTGCATDADIFRSNADVFDEELLDTCRAA
jgi:hypothetical protein